MRSGHSLQRVHRPVCLCQELGAIFCTEKPQHFFLWLRHPAVPLGVRGSPVHPLPDRGSLFWGAGRGTCPSAVGLQTIGDGQWKAPVGCHSLGAGRAAAGRHLHPAIAVSCALHGPCASQRGVVWWGGARGQRALGKETPPPSDGPGHALISPSEATGKGFYFHLLHLGVPDPGWHSVYFDIEDSTETNVLGANLKSFQIFL